MDFLLWKTNGLGNLTYTDAKPCPVIPCITTGLNNQQPKLNLSIYPNPFSNRIQLKIQSVQKNYQLYNSMGVK